MVLAPHVRAVCTTRRALMIFEVRVVVTFLLLLPRLPASKCASQAGSVANSDTEAPNMRR